MLVMGLINNTFAKYIEVQLQRKLLNLCSQNSHTAGIVF